MRLYSYMIVKNEADRYLEQAIASLRTQVDGLFVLDDRSTDNTPEILSDLRVPHRINRFESFLEDESRCRQNAWKCMEKELILRRGDWVLTLDADEILQSRIPLKDIIRRAERDGNDGLILHVREVWEEGKMRIDGAWGQVSVLRMCQWQPNGMFRPEQMGGGSVPSYVSNKGFTSDAEIHHYGYLNPEDRVAKHARYSAKRGKHNLRHIKSILEEPMLAPLPNMV